MSDLAGVRLLDAGHDLDQRRLAGAVLAEQRVDLAAGTASSETSSSAWVAAEALGDAAHLQDRPTLWRFGCRPPDRCGRSRLSRVPADWLPRRLLLALRHRARIAHASGRGATAARRRRPPRVEGRAVAGRQAGCRVHDRTAGSRPVEDTGRDGPRVPVGRPPERRRLPSIRAGRPRRRADCPRRRHPHSGGCRTSRMCPRSVRVDPARALLPVASASSLSRRRPRAMCRVGHDVVEP